MAETETTQRMFHITVLGRTLEHLGTQMYKRRDVAIAELVANCWDAGATRVAITLPSGQAYSPTISKVVVADNGSGMSEEGVESQYLVIGRNRRADGQIAPGGRRVMGRKGVGKLAGFGLGKKMKLVTVHA
ncbi:MAG: ATP-binding protein, partial [Nocardioides sp.]